MGKIVLRLDRMMVERHISLNELAGKVGISNVNLSKIKNNKVTAMRFSILAAICKVLDCQVGDIIEFQKMSKNYPIPSICNWGLDIFLVNWYLHLYISILKHCAMITQRKLFQQKEGCLMRNKKLSSWKHWLIFMVYSPFSFI